jgi:hypothetical protein
MEEENIIYKENIDPFKEKIFNGNQPKIIDFINGNDNIPSLPTIPKIYFNKDTNNDKIGSDIINKYNIIKINIKKLEIIKNFIISILKTSQFELENIKIPKKKYKLEQDNLIINIENTFNETFKDQKSFNNFINNYVKENYNIIKYTKSDVPYFYTIFQNEYLGTNKNFFLDLFKKYIKIRKIILPYIKNNSGLLGFNMIFELNDNIQLDKIKNIEKEKLKKNNKNYINYNKYILYGKNIINNSNIINNKFKNSETETAKKPTLQFKIHKSNLLYLERNNVNYYNGLHSKKLTDIYNNIINSKNNFLDNDTSLYNVTINLIEFEFNLIKFIFNYIDIILFNNFIDVHIKIKRYIYEKINTFSIYYEPYIEWYNNVILGLSTPLIGMNKSEVEDFKEFFNTIIKEIDGNGDSNNSTN